MSLITLSQENETFQQINTVGIEIFALIKCVNSSDYLSGVCQQILYNQALGEPIQVSVFLLECRFQQIFFPGMAVSCGQRNNRPRGEAHFQLLLHSPFCSEQPLQTHRPLSNKSHLPREAVKQQNYSLHRLVFLAADNEQRSEVN